ncbi:MAG: hypothetical protein AAB800_00590 [Patescibacteria group bacterium]
MQDKWFRVFKRGAPGEYRELVTDDTVGKTIDWEDVRIHQPDPAHLTITVKKGDTTVEVYERIPALDKQLQFMTKIPAGSELTPFGLPTQEPSYVVLFLQNSYPEEGLVYVHMSE